MPQTAIKKLNSEQLTSALKGYIAERKAEKKEAKNQGKLFQNYFSLFGFLAGHSAKDKIAAAEKVINGNAIPYNDYRQLTDGRLGEIMKQAEAPPANFIKAKENAENMLANTYRYGYGGMGMVK